MSDTGKRDIVYEIKERIGVIKPYPTGWNKELNMVAWNGGSAKYDIRDWDPEHEHMSRGITLHPEEMQKIMTLLESREIG